MVEQFSSKVEITDKKGARVLFLIGLFSLTQVKLGAKLGISEFFCCLVGPFLYFSNLPKLRRDGVTVFFNLLILWMVGAVVADVVNHSEWWQFRRGVPVPIVIFCTCVCVYHYLRRNPLNLKWLVLGLALSTVVSTFIFQGGTAGDMAAMGDFSGAMDRVVGYKLFWSNMIDKWFSLPIKGWYFSTSMPLQCVAMGVIACVCAITGGRSAFTVKVLSLFLIVLGARSVQAIKRIHRMFPLIILAVMCLAVAIKGVYSYAAEHGYLSEYETRKYEGQTTRGTGFLDLLMGGRSEFFVGLIAALDKPLLGHGSWALDKEEYAMDFLVKYGTNEEINNALHEKEKCLAMGLGSGIIPSHSHVVCYWLWHGIFGLIFWLYIFKLVIDTMWKRLAIIPEWFGFFAVLIPAWLWDFFFSPFGQRGEECMLFCAMLVLLRLEKLSKKRPMQSMY